MSVKERFIKVFENSGKNQTDFGKSIGTNRQGVADILNDRKKLPFEIAEILHNKYGIDLNWLIAGTGKMKVNEYGENEKVSFVLEEKEEYQNAKFGELIDKIKIREEMINGLEEDKRKLIDTVHELAKKVKP